MASTAAGFVAFTAAHLDRRSFGRRRIAGDQALVPSGQLSTEHADGVELVDLLGDGQEGGHGAEGLTTEIHIRSGDDDAPSLVSKSVYYIDDACVQKLDFINGHHLGQWGDPLRNLSRCRDGNGLHDPTVVGAHPPDPPVTVIEVGLEDLDVTAGDQSSTDSADQLLGLPGVHDTRNDLDPPTIPPVMYRGRMQVHGRTSWERGRRSRTQTQS
jgi:hypothetical protein